MYLCVTVNLLLLKGCTFDCDSTQSSGLSWGNEYLKHRIQALEKYYLILKAVSHESTPNQVFFFSLLSIEQQILCRQCVQKGAGQGAGTGDSSHGRQQDFHLIWALLAIVWFP